MDFFLMGSQNWGEDEMFFRRQLYLLFFALPGAVPVYLLLVCIPKLFQNTIFFLFPYSWLPSASGSFPYQIRGEAWEQLRWDHKEKELQSWDRQCHITSLLYCSSFRDATFLGYRPKQHLPCRDWQTPHISWSNEEHQQLHLPKGNRYVCGWWYELASETKPLQLQYCKPAWGPSYLKRGV